MIRLNIVVEGQTEETFVNRVLADHLGAFNISTTARSVQTSRKGATRYRGGVLNYSQVRRDIDKWMHEGNNPDAYFTTMLGFYALPHDFPDFATARGHSDPYVRVSILETALARDLPHLRFVPYLQLHEFEALLLADPQHFDCYFLDHADAIQRLSALAQANTPELIDDGPLTAPSKRIIAEIPEYAGQKVSAGPVIAQKIGIATLRERCPHFHQWLEKLEQLVVYQGSNEG